MKCTNHLKVMACFLTILELAAKVAHLKKKTCIVYISRYVKNLFYSLMHTNEDFMKCTNHFSCIDSKYKPNF